MPPTVPLSRSRSQQFDDLVLDAVEHLEHRWSAELAGVEFDVEDVPEIEHPSPDVTYGTDVVGDGSVPLARLVPAGRDRQGAASPPRIVIYRRPLETRSQDLTELADLVHDVVVEQVANLLGRDPDDIDQV